jgi:hypothetical protein
MARLGDRALGHVVGADQLVADVGIEADVSGGRIAR